MAPNMLPQIRVSDIDILSDWPDLSQNVKAFSHSIPGYRSGASTSTHSFHPCQSSYYHPLR